MNNNQPKSADNLSGNENLLQNTVKTNKVILDIEDVEWLYRNSQSVTKRLKSIIEDYKQNKGLKK